jgi:membrane protein DedA with SNARE-associated domain
VGAADRVRARLRGIARLHLAADPGLRALVAIGALIGPSGISFWPVWIAGSLGAA